jgi:hypothetical protein
LPLLLARLLCLVERRVEALDIIVGVTILHEVLRCEHTIATTLTALIVAAAAAAGRLRSDRRRGQCICRRSWVRHW